MTLMDFMDVVVRISLLGSKEIEDTIASFGDVGDEAFVKVNAVDFRKGCYTSPKVIADVVRALRNLGAKRVYVMENSTQGNFTRLVFKVTGIAESVKKAGGRVLYLDEERSVKVQIGNFEVDFPKIVYERIVEGDAFYLSLPKLKTHDMTKVTLNLKNQFGFIYHKDRRTHHSRFELHKFIAAIYDFIKPDLAIIDGEYAIVHGHYPLEKMLDRYMLPMNVMIASNDALACDIVAAKILGYDVSEIEHLRIAEEKYRVSDRIKIEGEIEKYMLGRQPYEPLGIYPKGVRIVRGDACREGCMDNTLMVLEMLHVDYGGEGEFTIVFGKGIDVENIENLKPPVLVVGKCAVDEVGKLIREKYGKVVEVPFCNDLAAVTEALMKFMGIKPVDVVPLSTFELLLEWLKAKIHRSTARTPSII